jgi:Tfp pilus assembly protein PilV
MYRTPLKSSIKGFTIAEVLLSGFVLTVGMVTVMSLFSASHRQSFDTRNVIIASGLAQEGAEIARNIRDNNLAYRTKNWTTGDTCSTSMTGNCDPFRSFPTTANQRCAASYGDATFTCSNPTFALGLNGNGLYQHGAGVAASRFYRVLKINHASGGDTARVQSFVIWQNPGSNLDDDGAVSWCTIGNQCVYTELFLDNWK